MFDSSSPYVRRKTAHYIIFDNRNETTETSLYYALDVKLGKRSYDC